MKKYIVLAALSLAPLTINATTANVNINLSTADSDKLSDATLSMTNTYNEIEGKISVKVDSASNGKNSNPKIDEMYLIKNGFKAGKQALKFGISDTNFNTLHSSTEKSQSMSGIGLSFTGETKKINYTLFVGKDTSSADINKDFKEGIIAGNFGFSASKSGDKVAYISAASGKWGVFAQKTNEKKYYNGASVTTTSTQATSTQTKDKSETSRVETSTTSSVEVGGVTSNALIEVSYQFRPDLRLSLNNQNMAAINFAINKSMVLNTEFNQKGKSNINLGISF